MPVDTFIRDKDELEYASQMNDWVPLIRIITICQTALSILLTILSFKWRSLTRLVYPVEVLYLILVAMIPVIGCDDRAEFR